MQDYYDNVILNLYVMPVKPIVSYLEPLTGYEHPGNILRMPYACPSITFRRQFFSP